jgi:hypothetical protein
LVTQPGLSAIFFRQHRLGGVMGGTQDISVRDVAFYMIINQRAKELRQG